MSSAEVALKMLVVSHSDQDPKNLLTIYTDLSIFKSYVDVLGSNSSKFFLTG